MRRRRRRLVVATTTTVLACLSTVTTSLSHLMFTTLPFVAQQLQVASDYLSWRQVERLQLVYNYSCQLGDYYRSYYRTTLELYHNMTTTPKTTGEVIDVEQTTGPATSLPPLKAPTVEPLGRLEDGERLLGEQPCQEPPLQLRLQRAKQDSWRVLRAVLWTTSSSIYRLWEWQWGRTTSMIETHNMWSPFHYSYVSDPTHQGTYYTVVEDSELEAWETTGRTTLTLSEWKSTTSKVFQHLHLHEHPLEALNYIIALIHNSMSTTIPPWNERLHLIALNLYPRTTVERHLMEYYQREGSDYKELENHSNTLQEMTKFTTSTTVISGPSYNYVQEMLTPAFYKKHLVDTTTISGPDHINYKSVRNMFNRHYDKTVEFLQEERPKLPEAARWKRRRLQLESQQQPWARRREWGLRPSLPTTTWRSWWSSPRRADYDHDYNRESTTMSETSNLQAHYWRECYYPWPDYCLRLEDTTTA